VKYTAEFDPQAWQNDQANSVDPEGETKWDCTAAVQKYVQPDGSLGKPFKLQTFTGQYVDNDDVLHKDPAAPQWVRDWRGPFTITVTRQEQPVSHEQPVLGTLPRPGAGRDAVHVAVFPAFASHALSPGDPIRLTGRMSHRLTESSYEVVYSPPDRADAIVDPFLPDPLPPGTTFYGCFKPGTVTGLRHVYTHEAFARTVPVIPTVSNPTST
jgi:hypothetical protein